MRQLMTPEDLDRATRRIAHEIAEGNRGIDNIVILGIPTRGQPFAARIAAALSEIEGSEVNAGSVDIGMYRDDLDSRPKTRIGPTILPEPIDGKVVILADDVLYTGRTIRAALDALADLGRPAGVQLAVMVDRGHRELPIRADYVGKNIPTATTERVSVHFSEVDGDDGVWVSGGEGA